MQKLVSCNMSSGKQFAAPPDVCSGVTVDMVPGGTQYLCKLQQSVAQAIGDTATMKIGHTFQPMSIPTG